jgi:protein gp37
MSVNTKIQWTDSTVNPTMGCEGCELWNPKTNVRKCYAGMLHVRFGKVTKGYSQTFEELTFWPGRMADAAGWSDLTGTARKAKPWLDGLPRLIFVSDMSDALSAAVPFEYLEAEIVGTVASPNGQRHQWLWLTKRPDRMSEFSAMLSKKGVQWPTNLWAGTSITTQGTTGRVNHLLRVGNESTIRFLSVEPQHGAIQLDEWLPRLNWVIQGGESGRKAHPFQVEWAHDLIRQCRTAHVAYFLKQLGSAVFNRGRPLKFADSHAGNWDEWPTEIRLREMPLIAVPDPSPDCSRIHLPVIAGSGDRKAAALKA